MEGKVPHAGLLAAPDRVLDPGAAAVAKFELGDLCAFGVGEKRGEAVAVMVGVT